MKTLLVRLTLGLHEQDVSQTEHEKVDEWLKKGYLLKEGNIYRLPSKYRAGSISLSQNGSAYLQVVGANVRDLFIDSDHLHGAKDGDLVIARRLLGQRGAPSAKVVEIVGRLESYSVAYVALREHGKTILDIRTGHPAGVEIDPVKLNGYAEGTLFKINNQTNEIMEVLGSLDDPKVDEKIVLAAYNKHDEFDDEVLRQARSFDKRVEASQYPQRKDLRDLPFCTIDPVTAKDFDDAVCYIPAKSILYVAIADVSAYVEPFGAIDAEAAYRGFSIYLPHRSIPMLPRELSETLCSLQPHVDRLAYVFELHINKDSLEVERSELYEAVINSKRRFNYEEIDSFFEGTLKAANDDEQRVMDFLLPLRTLTEALKARRLENGYDFRSKELEMYIDENQELITTKTAEETPSHAVVEDCMLLANKAAASMYDHGVFRIHEQPSPKKLQALYQELAGIGIVAEQKPTMKETITLIQDEARRRGLESEVDTLIIRSQMRARYAPENIGHFGLGFKRYTHFTSPIRRYSDLIVHRLLKAIQANDTEEGSYVLRNIDALCFAISDKEREAADIEIRFMQRKFARWAGRQIGLEFKARISSTDPVYTAEILEPFQGAEVILNVDRPVLLFDDVVIRIENVDLATAKIHATLVSKEDE